MEAGREFDRGLAVFRGPEPGGAVVERNSRYFTIWRKTREGWRVALDIGTGGVPRKR